HLRHALLSSELVSDRPTRRLVGGSRPLAQTEIVHFYNCTVDIKVQAVALALKQTAVTHALHDRVAALLQWRRRNSHRGTALQKIVMRGPRIYFGKAVRMSQES